ncbi:MAG: hypothetical protein PGN27_15035 [Mycolicibacterium neoaurum]|uniref:hypothetical protein n=1 Tax=Mycolicibacterium neoaurum TaxID=1795 RepID=UPI002FFB70A8
MSTHDGLRAAMRAAGSALKEQGPDFALAGSFALWAAGGPEPVHDVDFVVAEPDAEAATLTLDNAGFDIERPPEDWLFKAHMDGALVDVLHRVNGEPVTAKLLDRAEPRDVLAIRMPVLPVTVVLTQKLRALNEHHCDFAALLPAVRAVREQVCWTELRDATAHNDFAAAFLVLADRLGLTGQ